MGSTRVGTVAVEAAAAIASDKTAVEKERRIDLVREVADTLERLPYVARDLLQDGRYGTRVGLEELAGVLKVHRDRDEVLLDAVVQVALDASALGIRLRDEPGSGLPDLVRHVTRFDERRRRVQPAVRSRHCRELSTITPLASRGAAVRELGCWHRDRGGSPPCGRRASPLVRQVPRLRFLHAGRAGSHTGSQLASAREPGLAHCPAITLSDFTGAKERHTHPPGSVKDLNGPGLAVRAPRSATERASSQVSARRVSTV